MNVVPALEWQRFLRTDHAHVATALSRKGRTWWSRMPHFYRVDYSDANANRQICKNDMTLKIAYDTHEYSVLQFWYELEDNSFQAGAQTLVFKEIFVYACANGHIYFLNLCARHLSRKRLYELFCFRRYWAFYRAIRKKQVKSLDFFACQFTRQQLNTAFTEGSYFAFACAAYYGSVKCLDFFADHISQEQLSSAFVCEEYRAFHLAIQMGEFECLEFFTRRIGKAQLALAFASKNYNAFHIALQQNQIHVLDFYERHFGKEALRETLALAIHPHNMIHSLFTTD